MQERREIEPLKIGLDVLNCGGGAFLVVPPILLVDDVAGPPIAEDDRHQGRRGAREHGLIPGRPRGCLDKSEKPRTKHPHLMFEPRLPLTDKVDQNRLLGGTT